MLAIVGAGSNLGARATILRAARAHLDALGVRTERCSHTYESPALVPPGRQPGPAFLNEAWRVRTARSPRRLLQLLLEVERRFGRERDVRWGDRTLDLDILWMPQEVCLPELRIPHPGLRERPFAIAPVLDVEPSLRHLLRGMRRRPRRVNPLRAVLVGASPNRVRDAGRSEAEGHPADALGAVLDTELSQPVPAASVIEVRAPLRALPDAIVAARMRIARVAVLDSPAYPGDSAWRIALVGTPGDPGPALRLESRVVAESPMRLWVSAS